MRNHHINSSTVLVLGSGGREEAIALAFANDTTVSRVYVVPGNVSAKHEGLGSKLMSVDLDLDDGFNKLAIFCKENSVDLVVPGPENYIVAGVRDKMDECKLY